METVLQGILIEDEQEELMARLDHLPPDLEAIYTQNLSNLDQGVAKESFFIF